MSAEQFERFFILEQFREFCVLVLRFKQELEASASPSAGADEAEPIDDLVSGDAGEDGEPIDPARLLMQRAEFVRGELISLMQRQAQEVLRRGDDREQRRFREVQYVMAAMADEVLLNLSWPGKEYFAKNLIEEEIFRTHDAGTRFFTNLDELLRLRDPTRAEVSASYLLALSLGFRGRYREVEGNARIENYRLQLFATLFQRNPGLADDQQLYPQAYAHTLAGKQLQWLPLLRPWLIGMGGVALAYVIIAHVVWAHASGNVASAVEHLGERGRPPAPPPAAAPQARAPVHAPAAARPPHPPLNAAREPAPAPQIDEESPAVAPVTAVPTARAPADSPLRRKHHRGGRQRKH